jgi:hypothetical protein
MTRRRGGDVGVIDSGVIDSHNWIARGIGRG